jgi:hypothetical protein
MYTLEFLLQLRVNDESAYFALIENRELCEETIAEVELIIIMEEEYNEMMANVQRSNEMDAAKALLELSREFRTG